MTYRFACCLLVHVNPTSSGIDGSPNARSVSCSHAFSNVGPISISDTDAVLSSVAGANICAITRPDTDPHPRSHAYPNVGPLSISNTNAVLRSVASADNRAITHPDTDPHPRSHAFPNVGPLSISNTDAVLRSVANANKVSFARTFTRRYGSRRSLNRGE